MAGTPGAVRVTVDGFVRYVEDRLNDEDRSAGVERPHNARRIARAMLTARRGAIRHGILEELAPICREAFGRLVPPELR